MKRITKGEFRGLNEISEYELQQKDMLAKEAIAIPTQNKVVAVGHKRNLTSDWCKNGDIDRCPAPCGACLYSTNVGTLQVRKAKIIQILDEFAYLVQIKESKLSLN
jgi:hypothetical protein